MHLKIDIDLNNDVFVGNPDAEVNRILRDLTGDLCSGQICKTALDRDEPAEGVIKDRDGVIVADWRVADLFD